MEKALYIAALIDRKIRSSISEREQAELRDWIAESPANKEVFANATDPEKQLSKLEIYEMFDRDQAWSSLEEELFKKKTIPLHRRPWLRIAAAILVPLLAGGAVLISLLNRAPEFDLAELDKDISPGGTRATLVLSDGASVALDANGESVSLVQGSTRISGTEQGILYSADASSTLNAGLFNELHTPRGGTYQLKLSDGSSAWLNTSSSLRFPVAFNNQVREVFLEGEAFFEVTPGDVPFIVHTGNSTVEVLGTSFNISAYSDNPLVKTTLVEGKVRISFANENEQAGIEKILAPGQQASVDPGKGNISVEEVNTSIYTSWRTGKIEFENEDLEVVMKRLSRWYDFNYTFVNEEAKGYHFSARFNRNEKVSVILEMLEMTTEVQFEYRENTIVVK